VNLYIKLIFLLFCYSAFAQIPTDIPLELREQFNGQFDYIVIGNTLNEFDTFQVPQPPCQLLTQSSTQLNLNPNQNIVGAYLYWSGIGDGTENPIIQLNGVNLTADELNVVDPGQTNFFFYFGAYKNITTLVQNLGNTTYNFSNLDLNPIISNYCSNGVFYAGWSIVVVFEDNSLPTQQVNVYDGLNSVFGTGSNFNSSINIDNLNVVDTQNARFSYLAWNGSANVFFNESLTFNGNILSDAINPPNNPFNGTNTYTGATNLWSMDLDVFDISNFITLGDSQAEIVFSSVFLRLFQNVVTVIRSELPDAQVELVNFTGISECDDRDFTIETIVSNPESSDILPANTPISFFVLDSNDNEVFLDTFFTQNPIPINGSETQFFDISIPAGIPDDTTLIVKVNTLADGSNPTNENNILNNSSEQQLNLLSSPNPIAVQDLTQCANLSEAVFNLEDSFTDVPNPNETLSFHLSLIDAQNNLNPIADPQNYSPNSLQETIFIRQSQNGCFTITQFEVNTLIPPQITEPSALTECDTSTDQSGFASFDLNAIIPEITGDNPDYEVDFFLTQAEAEDLTITNGLDSPFTNTNAFMQTLFIRVTDTTNACVAFTTLALEVNALPDLAEASSIQDLKFCDDNNNGEEIFDLTLNNSAILNGLDPNTHQIRFYTSQTDAENNSNDINTPTAFASNGQSIFVSVTETATGCFSATSFDLVVNPIPDLQSVPTNAVCDENGDGFANFDLGVTENFILPDPNGFSFQYFESLNDAQNSTNPITNPDTYQNTQSPMQTIYVLVTNETTNCQAIQSFDIEVLEQPQITEPSALTECDTSTDQSGFAGFDLNAIIPEIIGNNPNYEVDFFLTQAEAEDLTITNGLDSPFTNTNPFTQTLFIRVTDTTNGCVAFTTLALEVNALPDIAEAFNIPDLELCDADDNAEEIFDLTENNSIILNGIDLNTHQIRFYTSQTDAENNTNVINTPTAFTSNGQSIFVSVTEISTGCFSLTSFDLTVNPIPDLQSVPTNAVCDEDDDGFANFDLGVAENFILPDPNGFSFQYFESLNDAQNSTNPITNPDNYQNTQSPLQTIYVLVTNESTNCQAIQSFDIEVLEQPQITEPSALSECDTSTDQSGFASFDLNSKIPEITGNNPDYEVDFFLTQAEAEDLTITSGLDSTFTNTTAFTQTLFIRVTDTTNGCVTFTTLVLEVNQDVDFIDESQLTDLIECDEDDTAIFDLTQIENNIFDTESPDDFSVSYFTSLSDAEQNLNPISSPDSFQNTEMPQNIWVRVSGSDSLDNCFDIASFGLNINFLPVASTPENLFLCDVDNDQIETFDLSQQNDSILNGLSDIENSISYHKTLADAETNSNPIDSEYTNENNPQTIFVRLENNNANNCFSTTSFEIEVLENPSIQIDNELVLCQDEPLTVSIDSTYDEYLWSTGNTSSSITITEAGDYEVTALINYPEFSCETSQSFQVILSDEASISEITTVDWSQNNNSITVLVEGNGAYEFSIDGINYQDSNVFENLTGNEYLVHIRDKNGCGEILKRVYLLDFPQFFTPNGDGINDRWQIINSVQEVLTKIYIFDRYGKLVADINPAGNGWDGTFNGNALPSNDYWFRVEREDGRIFTGHFTLKR